MGAITLELRCPGSINGVSVDPQPEWTFDALVSELNLVEKKLNAASIFPLPFIKSQSRGLSAQKDKEKGPRAFIMRVADDDCEDEDYGEANDLMLVSGNERLVEVLLSELREHQLSVMEEVRNQIYAFETDLINENEIFTSALGHVDKKKEARREIDRKHDIQYRRRIAEAVDNHLTAIQRDHEHKSQIEERRIRDAAAREEAKRKEKTFQEEKVRQEKIKAEAEARAEAEKKRAEVAKAEALEADRRAAKEAAEKVASEPSGKAAAATVASKESAGKSEGSGFDGSKKVQGAGNIIKGAESALREEERRLQIYMELAAPNEALGLGSNKDYRSHGMQIARRIKTITGTKENVRAKADELINIFFSSPFPQSISIALFAEKVVSQCANPTGSFSTTVFAYAHVIVLVTSKVPLAMDILLAELNRVCIFTVPKYINYSESAFESKEAYYKSIGYQEEDRKIESTDSYLERLSSCMKLYGALVQTEIGGVQNPHGLREGWTWFARFLNALPANLYTAVALHSFLEMAGFALYRKFKSQFKKLLNIVARDFLNALRERGDQNLNKVIINIQTYIESNQYLKEPEGWRLQSSLLSHTFVPEVDRQENYHHSNGSYY